MVPHSSRQPLTVTLRPGLNVLPLPASPSAEHVSCTQVMTAAGQPWHAALTSCLPAEQGAHDVCARVSGQALLLWQGLVQPLFFALTGAALDFGSIAGDVAPKTVGIAAVGLAGRVAANLACLPMGLPLNPPSQQRMFAALALVSKVSTTVPENHAEVGTCSSVPCPTKCCLLRAHLFC